MNISVEKSSSIVFFTGAGMSAESGVPTYRGEGGVWHEYKYEEYACQQAFEKSPEKVMEFHNLRRTEAWKCSPHEGHKLLANLENEIPDFQIITQNIDGMHQRAGNKNVIELHGSLWRVRCPEHGIIEDLGETYESMRCRECDEWLRPDIVWFGDFLKTDVMDDANQAVLNCDYFISIGTSGVVWPAAGFAQQAKDFGAICIEINPEESEMSHLYDYRIREKASLGIKQITFT